MKIDKILSWSRIILSLILIIPIITLVQNKYYIEAGLLALYLVYMSLKSKISSLEKRLDDLEKK